MKAQLLLRERYVVRDDAFAEIVVWRTPKSVRGSTHSLKYSLAFIVNGACVLRYDNEAGKGDHKHLGEVEARYAFTSPEQLLQDFWRDVDEWDFK
jgi:hypothetical protein